MDEQDPRQQLLAELADTVSFLLAQMALLGEADERMGQTLDTLMEQMNAFYGMERDGENVIMGEEEYFDGTEHPLYQVKCPRCGDMFAVDEDAMIKGFRCPTCEEHLVQAE